MVQRKSMRPAGLLFAIVLVLSGCAQGVNREESGAPTGQSDGDTVVEEVDVLRMAGGDFGYPSPFAWVRGPGRIQAGYVFDTLLWQDATGEPIAWLAEDWEVSDDGLEWRFTLREDATWQDSEPLTAKDVAFTFDYLTNGPGADTSASGGLDIIDEVVAEDDRTVVFRLPVPYAAFTDRVATSMFVLPEHVWADVDDPAQYREDDATMGSGPYRLIEADEAAGSYLYEANEDFYISPPVVQRLEFVPAPDQLLALERGEIDAAEIDREPVPDEQFNAFDEQFGRVDGSGDWNHALHFNLNAGFPYSEREFRQAVAYAVDQQDMVDRLLLGRGQPGSPGGLAPSHPFLAEDLPGYEHDPEQADELLDGLGIVDANGDGLRDLPDGQPFTIELNSSSRYSAQDPELVAEYLRQAGLDTTVAMLDRSAADEAVDEGNFEMALHGYGGLEGDPDLLRSRYASESDSGVPGYDNPEFNDLADQQLGTTDSDERRELVVEMQRILAEDLPVLSLYVPTRYLFYDEATFDSWYYTPGCSPCRGSRNKHMYVTGQETGIPES